MSNFVWYLRAFKEKLNFSTALMKHKDLEIFPTAQRTGGEALLEHTCVLFTEKQVEQHKLQHFLGSQQGEGQDHEGFESQNTLFFPAVLCSKFAESKLMRGLLSFCFKHAVSTEVNSRRLLDVFNRVFPTPPNLIVIHKVLTLTDKKHLRGIT